MAVEPGRAVAGHLPVEVVGAEDAQLRLASTGGLVGGGTRLEVLRDEPAVGISPFHDAGAAKRLEPPDMGSDIGVVVATRDTDIAALDPRPMLARTIDPGAAGDLRDIAVGRASVTGTADLDDRADRHLPGSRPVRQRHVMDPAIDAVDHDTDAVAELIGELLVDQAAVDWALALGTLQGRRLRVALLSARGEPPVDGLADVAALAQPAHGRPEPLRKRPYPRLGLPGEPIAVEGLQAPDPQ